MMQPTIHFMGSLICGIAIFATTLTAVSCAKEKLKEEEPEKPEVYDCEMTVYMKDKNTALDVWSTVDFGCITGPNDSPLPEVGEFSVQVGFTKAPDFFVSLEFNYGKKIKFITKEFKKSDIIAINVVASSNYDSAHPKGSSLNDLMDIWYPNPEALFGISKISLDEYFKSHLTIGWNFSLHAKTPPLKENLLKDDVGEGFEVIVHITMEDRTVIAPITRRVWLI